MKKMCVAILAVASIVLTGGEPLNLLKAAQVHISSRGTVRIQAEPGVLVGKNNKTGTLQKIVKEGNYGEWSTLNFTLEAEQKENLFVILTAPNHPARPAVIYSELKAAGRKVENADFSQGLQFWGRGNTERGELIRVPGASHPLLSVTCRKDTYRRFQLEPGEKLSIRVTFRPAGATLLPKEFHAIDLRSRMNRGFRDEVAGDNRGGWSDQGPDHDMRQFHPAQKEFLGIFFDVVDPAQNRGNSVVVFDSPHSPTGVKTVTVRQDLPESRYLYLLHSSAWTPGTEKEIAFVTLHYADGTTKKETLEKRRHIEDWSAGLDSDSAKVAFTASTGQGLRHLFITKLVTEEKKISKVEFSGSGKSVWMLVAATATNRDWKPLKRQNLVFQQGPVWKKADFPSREILENSILNFSSQLDFAPCGSYGKVVEKNGFLVFEKRPEHPIRFFGHHSSAEWVCDWEPDEKLYLEQMRRTGNNALRLSVHRLSNDWWMSREENQKRYQYEPDGFFIAYRIRNFCRYVAEMNRKGIYLLLGSGGAGLDNSIRIMIGVPEDRELYRQEVIRLLNYVNPFTGRKIKDEPCIIGWQFCNEQSPQHLAQFSGYEKRVRKSTWDFLRKKWHAWLKNQYRNHFPLLRKEYGREAAGFSKFEEVPLVNKYTDRTVLARDFQLFTQSVMDEMFRYYRETIRTAGYNGPASWGNYDKVLRVTESRRKNNIMTEVNTYHSFYHLNRVPQLSSIGNALLSFRDAAGSRIPGFPLLVTEYNDNHLNRYSHEFGLTFPAYSALQNFSGLFFHNSSVITDRIQAPESFDKTGCHVIATAPMMRAGVFLAACLYGRGDVSASRHMVVLNYDRNFMKTIRANGYPNAQQTRLALLSGFGVDFPSPGRKAPVCDLAFPGYGNDAADYQIYLLARSGDSEARKDMLAAHVEELRKKGILSPDNRTDIAKGVFESDTGELLLETTLPRMRVVTPRTEVISLPRDGSAKASLLEVRNTSTSTTVAATAMDRKPLEKSSRIVLLFITENAWEGSIRTPDGDYILSPGPLKRNKQPVGNFLVKSGSVNLRLKNSSGGKFVLYPLSLNGIRREPIPIRQKGDRIEITIDTAKLKHGVTPFFELAAEP